MTTNNNDIIGRVEQTGVTVERCEGGWPIIIHASEAMTNSFLKSASWMNENKALVDELLLAESAIYFRGFSLKNTDDFEAFIEAYPAQNIDYVGGVAPRDKPQGKTYESTKWPSHLRIPLHQEMAYMHRQPNKLCFFCVTAAETDGETLVGRVNEIGYDQLEPEFYNKLCREGLAYHRNLRDKDFSFGDEDIDRTHVDWQTQFQTDSREQVEKNLTENGYSFRWEDNGSLTFTYTTPIFKKHPVTGEDVPYQVFHAAQTSPAMFGDVYEKMKGLYSDDCPPPFLTTLGNGDLIAEKHIEKMKQLFEQVEVYVPYQDGDVLLVDNYKALHGRNTYEGDRMVRVTFLA